MGQHPGTGIYTTHTEIACIPKVYARNVSGLMSRRRRAIELTERAFNERTIRWSLALYNLQFEYISRDSTRLPRVEFLRIMAAMRITLCLGYVRAPGEPVQGVAPNNTTGAKFVHLLGRKRAARLDLNRYYDGRMRRQTTWDWDRVGCTLLKKVCVEHNGLMMR